MGNPANVGEVSRLAALLGLALSLSPGLFLFSHPTASPVHFAVTLDSARRNIPAAGVFAGWRDDFVDSTKISSSSGLELYAGVVRLQSDLLSRRG